MIATTPASHRPYTLSWWNHFVWHCPYYSKPGWCPTGMRLGGPRRIALERVDKQIHWNVVGPNFRDIHLNLDEVVGITIAETDEVAERMHTINTVLDRHPPLSPP